MEELYDIHEVAGISGHHGLNLSEFKDLHTYIERPKDIDASLYDEKLILNHAHFYELDELDEESITEKAYHLQRLIIREIIDFCNRNNIKAESVSFNIDHLTDSLYANNWVVGTNSVLAFFDDNQDCLCCSM